MEDLPRDQASREGIDHALPNANYAVIMRGLAFERAQVEWYEWMSKRLEL